jgi:hypothetical protein
MDEIDLSVGMLLDLVHHVRADGGAHFAYNVQAHE